MVAKKDTAEEQLLKLIEGGVPPPSAGSPQATHARWKVFWAQIGRRFSRRQGPGTDALAANLRWGIRFLWVVLVGLGCAVVVDMWLPDRPHQVSKALSGSEAVPSGQSPDRPEDHLRPLSVYISSTSARNPFTAPGSAKPAEPAPSGQPEAKSRLETLVQGLTVVGIDRSGEPRALIEDANKGRTYFVRIGEILDGMTVKQITQRGVVLSYEGKEVEIPY